MPTDKTKISGAASAGCARSADRGWCACLLQRFIWRLQALAWVSLYWWPTKALGAERASSGLGRLAAHLGPCLPRHSVVLDNLGLAFPEKSEDERHTLARAAWENIGRTAGELPHLPLLSAYGDARIVLIGAEHLQAIKASDRGAVFVSGHLANWEIMPLVICRHFADCLTVYRAPNNPYINKYLARLRHDYGMRHMAAKGLATRALMRALAAGRSVALFNDQKFNEGLAINFFGQAAMTAPGPAHLALKYAVPIVPVATHRTGPMRFTVRIHAPYLPSTTGDLQRDIQTCTAGISAFIERQIRSHPAQWLWQHRRWPEQGGVSETREASSVS